MSGEAVWLSVQGGGVCSGRPCLSAQGDPCLSVCPGGHVCRPREAVSVCPWRPCLCLSREGRVCLLVQGGCVCVSVCQERPYLFRDAVSACPGRPVCQERPYLFRDAVSACPGRPCLSVQGSPVCLSKEGRVCPARPFWLCLVQALPWPVLCVSCRTGG